MKEKKKMLTILLNERDIRFQEPPPNQPKSYTLLSNKCMNNINDKRKICKSFEAVVSKQNVSFTSWSYMGRTHTHTHTLTYEYETSDLNRNASKSVSRMEILYFIFLYIFDIGFIKLVPRPQIAA